MNIYYKNNTRFRRTYYLSFFSIISLFINPLLQAQPGLTEKSDQIEKSFSEEVYIRTDRDLYIAGEEVWLKIFKLNGLEHKPENLSKVVYIDLLDIYNNPIDQLKIGIDSYSGSASFRLPDTLSTGNYILRSYTNWMKNFSKDYFSYKSISVINAFGNINDIKISSNDIVPDSIIFTPEGGHLISGIEACLGFRILNRKGEPVLMKGALVSENGDTICYLKTENNGYGWVKFIPTVSSKIYLTTTNKRFPVKKFLIPEILDQGISLSFSKSRESKKAFIKIKTSNTDYTDRKFFITSQSASFINTKKEFVIGRDFETNIPLDEFPTGLSHLIVSDEKDNLLAERWIYNKPEQQLKYNIEIKSDTFLPRDKIKIGITVTDEDGAPRESDFSISVVKTFMVNKNNITNNYYRQIPGLSTIITDSVADINDFLLFYKTTYNSKNNNDNSAAEMPSYIPELEGHLISGTITRKKTGEPLKNENITLSYVGKMALCQFTKTDELGGFYFVSKEKGFHEIVIQPLSSEINDCYVEINNPFSQTFNNGYGHRIFYIDSSKLGDINKAIISMQIKKIYDPFSYPAVESLKESAKPNFYGAPDNTIMMSKYIELTSLKEVVKEIIPGVSTVKKSDKINFRLISKYQNQTFDNNPLVLVDGVPIYDLEKVLNANAKEIEKIDVLNTRYFISDVVLDGILHFVSKKGDLGVIDFDRSVFRLEYELMQNDNKFLTPDHSNNIHTEKHLPDFRNTLYWNPDMHTDNKGQSSVEFYASDESDNYIIIVEGIAQDGRTGISILPVSILNR